MQPSVFTNIKNDKGIPFKFEAVCHNESYGVGGSLINNTEEPLIAVYDQRQSGLNDNGPFIKELSYDEFMAIEAGLVIDDDLQMKQKELSVVQTALDCQLNYSFF